MELEGANVFPWPRGFRIGATLDALLTFLKSGGFRGHLKEVLGGPGEWQEAQIGFSVHISPTWVAKFPKW